MKKIITFLLLSTLYTCAQTFDVNIPLASHNESTFGEWQLKKIAPKKIDNVYKGKIVQLKNQKDAFYIESSDIEISNKELYVNNFLTQGYYTLDWKAKKGTIGDEIWEVSDNTKTFLKESDFYKTYEDQEGWEEIDWSMVLADYINNTIASLPTYTLEIKNLNQKPIKITELYTKTIFTIGGEASPGGAYFPTSNEVNYLSLQWDKVNHLKLDKALTIPTQQSVLMPLSIFVKKASQGDGPGELTVALFAKYSEEGKEKEELLTILNQSEDYGYLTGW